MLAVIFASDSFLSIFFDVYMNTKMKIQALVLLGKPAFEVLLGPQGGRVMETEGMDFR